MAAPSTKSTDERLRCRACGQVHKRARLVTLPDGRVVGNYSDEYRRYSEAAWVLRKFRVKRTRQEYLAKVQELRGVDAMMDLRKEMLEIWNSHSNHNQKGAK